MSQVGLREGALTLRSFQTDQCGGTRPLLCVSFHTLTRPTAQLNKAADNCLGCWASAWLAHLLSVTQRMFESMSCMRRCVRGALRPLSSLHGHEVAPLKTALRAQKPREAVLGEPCKQTHGLLQGWLQPALALLTPPASQEAKVLPLRSYTGTPAVLQPSYKKKRIQFLLFICCF